MVAAKLCWLLVLRFAQCAPIRRLPPASAWVRPLALRPALRGLDALLDLRGGADEETADDDGGDDDDDDDDDDDGGGDDDDETTMTTMDVTMTGGRVLFTSMLEV